MLTRKSGIMALVLGAAVLGAACEKKEGDIIIPPPPVNTVVKIAPNPVPPLNPGQTQQLVAVVTGNTNTAVTWSVLSGTSATVSAAGLVTASATVTGTTTIQAQSQADATAKDVVTVTVQAAGGGPVGQPSITIGSATVGNTFTPINPSAVAGVVNVTLNVDIPAGVNASAVRVTLNGIEFCRQSFATGSSADAAIEAVPQTIICSINTATTAADGTPRILNQLLSGNNSIRGEVVGATNNVLASATFQPIVMNNADVVTVFLSTSKNPVLGPGGFNWHGGDVKARLVPTIFTSAAGGPSYPTTLNLTLTASANAAIQGTASSTGANTDFNAGCSPYRSLPGALGAAPVLASATCGTTSVSAAATKTANQNEFTVTIPAATRWALGGVGQIEDPLLGTNINGVTVSGNAYVGLVAFTLDNTNFTVGAANVPQNLLRLDNLAPRFTRLDITPATLNCAPNIACYVSNFPFSAANNATLAATPQVAQTVDYGVDLQTTTFAGGTSAATLVAATNANQLPETAVSNSDLLQATSVDLLGNTRSVFATDVATCTSASSTSVAASNQLGGAVGCAVAPTRIQLFGVDVTAPVFQADPKFATGTAAAPAADNVITFTAVDNSTAPAGPSGIRQINVQIRRATPDGTGGVTIICMNVVAGVATDNFAVGGAARSCGTGSTVALVNGGTVTLPDAPGAYYEVNGTPLDIAGNLGTLDQSIQLRDFTAPLVGGIVVPASVIGNSTVAFSTTAADNVEIGDATPAVNYGGVIIQQPSTSYGTYGFDILTTPITAAFNVAGFVRSIEGTVAGAPSGTAQLATDIYLYMRDVAGVQLADPCPGVASTQNCTFAQQTITANVQIGIGAAAEPSTYGSANRPFGTGTNNQGTFFDLTRAATPAAAADTAKAVCSNNPVGADPACPTVTNTSVTFFAQARGPAITFNNPFQRVEFYVLSPVTGRWSRVCSASMGASDNTTLNVRTWAYQCSWSPTVPAGAYQWFALGVDGSGRGLASSLQNLTITSD